MFPPALRLNISELMCTGGPLVSLLGKLGKGKSTLGWIEAPAIYMETGYPCYNSTNNKIMLSFTGSEIVGQDCQPLTARSFIQKAHWGDKGQFTSS